MSNLAFQYRNNILEQYNDVLTPESLSALEAVSPLNTKRTELMTKRSLLRQKRILEKTPIEFLDDGALIGGTNIKVSDARKGAFEGSVIPKDLQRQWIQGTGPATRPNATTEKSLRNVSYALLSGADGWMFDGEDALGQVDTMSLDNQRNLKFAVHRDAMFLNVSEGVAKEMNKWSSSFLDKEIISDWKTQLDFTTMIYRVRGLHLDDRHITLKSGELLSATIVDACLYVTNNYEELQKNSKSIVLYLPKLQTAEEAAFMGEILDTLESHLKLEQGTIKSYVLIEQLEATYQLMEIRAALGRHFVGFNTGRWDYINAVSDACCWDQEFINPNIESISMSYAYMKAYEDRVRRCVNTPDENGNFALWQGGMEPNIPVGSPAGVKKAMEKATGGAQREQSAGASGKWVAHWKMVHIVRPIWEKVGDANQTGRDFDRLTYTTNDSLALRSLENAPRTLDGARNLLSVALQYGNAFLTGYQAAALKPADHFGNDDELYLMEDMATGEIRASILWEWLHKGGTLTEDDKVSGLKKGDLFSKEVFDTLMTEEYQKLLDAGTKDVHDETKTTTLPIVKDIVNTLVQCPHKAPWYIDLLNLCIGVTDSSEATKRIQSYYSQLESSGLRFHKNLDF
jgi:malate synthase